LTLFAFIISRHLRNVFTEGELERNSVVANFATTAAVMCLMSGAAPAMTAFADHFPEDDKDGSKKKAETASTVNKNGTTPEPQEDATSENPGSEPSVRPSTSGTNLLLPAVIILTLIGGAAFYFFRMKDSGKKSSKKHGFDDEDDFDDDETVDEDE